MDRLLRWLLLLLAVGNLIALAAIFWKKPLESMGWLPEPPARRVDLTPQPLPAIAPLPTTSDAPAETTMPESDPARDEEPETSTLGESEQPTPAIESSADAEAAESAANSNPESERETQPEPSASTEQPILACVVLGPFTDEADAQAAMTRIEQADGQPQLQTETIAAQPDYLVYVEPAVAKDIAVRTWQALQSQDIDAYVIPSGTREHGVSVGVFKNRERATAQQQRVSELGYAVEIHTLDRSATLYRVVARNVPSSALGASADEDAAESYTACDEVDL